MLSALRTRAGRSPRLRAGYGRLRRAYRDAAETTRILKLRLSRRRLPQRTGRSEVVVSLTSFPARIDHAWIPIETMLRQDHAPDRVVLVLADDEFPVRTLPHKLGAQQRRGLEILWIPRSARSFDKLLPARVAFPAATIITVDDDARYEPWLVSRLIEESRHHPGSVIGHRGREIRCDEDGLVPSNDWMLASRATPAGRVLLTGVGGVLYPPGVLPIDLLTDVDLARELCPTADDVWFWAVARVAGVPTRCLGLTSWCRLRRQAHTPTLNTINRDEGQNDVQLARVIEHFGVTVGRGTS